MEWTLEQIEIGKEFNLAIEEDDTERVRALVKKHPWLVRDYKWNNRSAWMCTVGMYGHVAMAKTLLDLGFNIDAVNLPEKSTALSCAIDSEYWDLVCFLLSRGANPNFGRAIVGAINYKDSEKRLKLVILLVEHGADVNQLYDYMGDKNAGFTVLDWTEEKSEVYAYLKSIGARSAKDLMDCHKTLGNRVPDAAKKMSNSKLPSDQSWQQEVIEYFQKEFGPVDKRSFSEVVPSGIPVTIHVIKPSKRHSHLTLFTTGLSQASMQVPVGQEEYAYAELFIQLPANWQYEQLADPNCRWPLKWLQKMAQYPHQDRTWLGGPLTIVANDDPPKPLAPNTKMTSLLLMAEKSFQRTDGKEVQLYRMLPLYTEERNLELREGAAALMQALDRYKISLVVDMGRKKFA